MPVRQPRPCSPPRVAVAAQAKSPFPRRPHRPAVRTCCHAIKAGLLRDRPANSRSIRTNCPRRLWLTSARRFYAHAGRPVQAGEARPRLFDGHACRRSCGPSAPGVPRPPRTELTSRVVLATPGPKRSSRADVSHSRRIKEPIKNPASYSRHRARPVIPRHNFTSALKARRQCVASYPSASEICAAVRNNIGIHSSRIRSAGAEIDKPACSLPVSS